MTGLGGLYENGLGVTQDYAAAFNLYGRAVSPDSPGAMNALGSLYENGRASSKTMPWRAGGTSARLHSGHTSAMYNFGRLYGIGHGVSRDYH